MFPFCGARKLRLRERTKGVNPRHPVSSRSRFEASMASVHALDPSVVVCRALAGTVPTGMGKETSGKLGKVRLAELGD